MYRLVGTVLYMCAYIYTHVSSDIEGESIDLFSWFARENIIIGNIS